MSKKCYPIIIIATLLFMSMSTIFRISAQPGIDTLGIPPNGTATYARGLSPEGTIVAGNFNISDSTGQAFVPVRWTPPNGVEVFAVLPGSNGGALLTDAASNGTAFSGFSYNAQGRNVACRWTSPNNLTSLGFLPNGTSSSAGWISDDGMAMAGSASSDSGQTGFHWTQTGGMVDIGDLPGGFYYTAVEGMSADGQTVVGWSRAADGPRAFRWTPGGGIINMGVFPGYVGSIATDASRDGSVIVGSCTRNDSIGQTIQAWRWTAANGLQPLGWLPGGRTSRANLISADGSVIVGTSDGTTSSGTFIWRENIGMIDFRDFLMNEYGVDISSWLYFFVDDISADGTAFTGFGRNAENRFIGWRIKLPQIAVSAPTSGERLHVEQSDTIRWKGPAGSLFLLEYSADDGRNYFTIDATTTPGDSQYVWRIPDNLRSGSQYRIRVTDAADTTSRAVSAPFTIKAHDLAEMRPGGVLEAFQPGKHGWRFRNDTTNMWPAAWWQQFDYRNGDDPYTAERYPGRFVNQYAAQSWNFPDWPVFVEAFTTSQCYWSVFFASYKLSAQNLWRGKKKRHRGSCYGLANASLLAFEHGAALRTRYPTIAQTDSIAALFMTPSTRKAINQYFVHQYGQVPLANDVGGAAKTPRDLLFEVRQMFADETNECRALSFYNNGGSGAHTVLPYRLVRDPANNSQFRLFVYDSNTPLSGNEFIFIDSTANTWSDSTTTNWGTGGNKCYLEPPGSTFLQTPVLSLPGSGGSTGQGTESTHFAQIYAPGAADVILTVDSGGQIGHVGGQIINTLSEGVAMIPKIGYPAPPDGYYVPEEPYAAVLDNFADNLAYLTVLADSQIYGYTRLDAGASQRDEVATGSGFSLRNPDNLSKTITMESVATGDSSDRGFELSGVQMGAGDSLHIADHQRANLTVVNVGGQKHYDLRITGADASGEANFRHAGIQLEGGSSQRIIPRWDDLLTQPVKILIDLNDDGTIDDSLFVSHQPVGIDDGERGSAGEGVIPERFVLEQNYPNPFNPVTNVEFGITEAEWVTLTIYDLLGRKVKTLVNEHRAPGSYIVRWNGTNDSGQPVVSGVYLYRLQAGEFIQTRKMLLIR